MPGSQSIFVSFGRKTQCTMLLLRGGDGPLHLYIVMTTLHRGFLKNLSLALASLLTRRSRNQKSFDDLFLSSGPTDNEDSG